MQSMVPEAKLPERVQNVFAAVEKEVHRIGAPRSNAGWNLFEDGAELHHDGTVFIPSPEGRVTEVGKDRMILGGLLLPFGGIFGIGMVVAKWFTDGREWFPSGRPSFDALALVAASIAAFPLGKAVRRWGERASARADAKAVAAWLPKYGVYLLPGALVVRTGAGTTVAPIGTSMGLGEQLTSRAGSGRYLAQVLEVPGEYGSIEMRLELSPHNADCVRRWFAKTGVQIRPVKQDPDA
jgi:hypothetical protein